MSDRDDVGNQIADGEAPTPNEQTRITCPVSIAPGKMSSQSSDLYGALKDTGCPLAEDFHKRLYFESLLTELSSKFVNVPAGKVDAQIEWGLRRIVEVLGIDRSGLGQVSADGKQFIVTHSYQMPGVPASSNFMLDTQFPFFARKLRQGVVVRLPDDLPTEATEEREYCLQTGMKSNVTIPLMVMGSTVGGIGFSSFRSHFILPDELIPRLRLVGDIFTNALARKRADEALSAKEQLLRQAKNGLRQLNTKLLVSQEEERSRIAREMHDDWTQRLALLGIDAAKLENQLGTQTDALPLVRAMRERLVSLAENVHELSRQLHPSIIQDLGLAEALRSECASFTRREKITVDYLAENLPANLPNDIALCIYRVAQESLRNVAKHAAVSKVSLKLVATGRELRLHVSDEGVGFQTDNGSSQPGIGLSSMEERVHLINGSFVIKSELGRGTTVEVRVPLEECKHG
jgi:signal transduction histidine kinase